MSGDQKPHGSVSGRSSIDDIFLFHLLEIERKYVDLPKYLRIRTEKWVKKLTALSKVSNKSFKKNRNEYSALLLTMVSSRAFSEPFNALPPAGQLNKLPPYLTLGIDKKSIHYKGERKAFWEDLYDDITETSKSEAQMEMSKKAQHPLSLSLVSLTEEDSSPTESKENSEKKKLTVSQIKKSQMSSSLSSSGVSKKPVEVKSKILSHAKLHETLSQQLQAEKQVVNNEQQSQLLELEFHREKSITDMVHQLDRTNESLKAIADECDRERSRRLRLESQLKQAEVLIRGQAQRIEVLEQEVGAQKRLLERERTRMKELHDMEIAELKRLHKIEMEAELLSVGKVPHDMTNGVFASTEEVSSLEPVLSGLTKSRKATEKDMNILLQSTSNKAEVQQLTAEKKSIDDATFMEYCSNLQDKLAGFTSNARKGFIDTGDTHNNSNMNNSMLRTSAINAFNSSVLASPPPASPTAMQTLSPKEKLQRRQQQERVVVDYHLYESSNNGPLQRNQLDIVPNRGRKVNRLSDVSGVSDTSWN
eukprot:g4275.t1